MSPKTSSRVRTAAQRPQLGLSLIELMVAITLGLLVMAAVLALFMNVTRTNTEMAKTNRQIENGRFAIQVLQDDLAHAGFWGTFVPNFDDLTSRGAPLDAPDAIPDPCLAYSAANWTADYTKNLVGIPVQSTVGTCTVVTNQQASTDVLVVRHAENCVAGIGDCEAEDANKLYFQASLCETEMSGIAGNTSTTTSISLNESASTTDGFYNGAIIRIVEGNGKGLVGKITDYEGSTRVATLENINVPAGASWVYVNNGSFYAFGNGYVLGDDGFIFHNRNCTDAADKRKLVSYIYYIRNFASTAGDGIPTLVRSSLDLSGSAVAYQPAQPLVEGIEGFRVEYGIDDTSDAGLPVNNSAAIAWADPFNLVSPTNRGDGVPDRWVGAAGVTCNSAADCDAANVVAVRVHVLARSESLTRGYTDTKTYRLGGIAAAMGPFNDGFKRHVFSTTIRLVNPAGRRDTP
jgi:Tfp pilus assembly protein PilW